MRYHTFPRAYRVRVASPRGLGERMHRECVDAPTLRARENN